MKALNLYNKKMHRNWALMSIMMVALGHELAAAAWVAKRKRSDQDLEAKVSYLEPLSEAGTVRSDLSPNVIFQEAP